MLAGERSKRNSIFSSSKNSAISVLRQKIKAANKDINALDDYDPYLPAEISKAQILINRKPVTVRKVYLTNSNYKIGWVVDYDLSYCMVCLKHFNWMTKLKHHCRACGSLVCSYCSPYKSIIPSLDQQEEEGGSRVCNNCFGLKTDVFESVQPKAKIDRINSTANGSNSSIHSNNSSNSSTNNPPGIGITTPYPTASNNRSSRRININTTSDNDTLSSTSNSPMSMLSSASSTRPQLGSVRRRSTNNRDKTKQKQSFNSELFEENLIEAMEIFEKEQLPKYEESYRYRLAE